ncbi:type III-A CRISPR-associated RAMP protein Csm5 [Thermus filiformis]|uniref:CRISPR system Cms protein Csm5 n=1 Tax=Thermus filiformis TaxID=276 RepID=A0A0A2WRG2_THEFI|nr:type III-A CRISPR-associated RAMP protein Csm5 [Thermus filiformis]KGQ22413.2 CRISPR-associated protein Csm5 [Thermus filiformis]
MIKGWHLELLSPVHVGTGEAYPAYAYVPDFEGKRVHLLDPSALLLALSPERREAFLRRVAEGPKGAQDVLRSLLKEGQLPPEAIRRTLPASAAFLATIQKASEASELEYRPLPYSPLGPYLPGSSVKGALRTAWLYWKLVQRGEVVEWRGGGWQFRSRREDEEALIRPPQNVDLRQNLAFEAVVLGHLSSKGMPDLYRDPFRAVRLTDSSPGEGFLNRIGVFHPQGKMDDVAILAETFRKGSRFTLLFRYHGGLAQGRGVAGPVPPKELVRALREYYGKVAEWERAYAQDHDLKRALEVYDDLEARLQDPGVFPIRIGFGSGRLALRLALLLPEDSPEAQDPTTRKTAGAKAPRDGYPLGWAVGRLVEVR